SGRVPRRRRVRRPRAGAGDLGRRRDVPDRGRDPRDRDDARQGARYALVRRRARRARALRLRLDPAAALRVRLSLGAPARLRRARARIPRRLQARAAVPVPADRARRGAHAGRAVAVKPYLIPAIVAAVAGFIIWAFAAVVLVHTPHMGLPLDDSYIYLTYAKQIGRAHPFTYFSGGGYSAGATSALWPIVL